MKYRLFFKPRSQKDLKELPTTMQKRVIEKLEGLTDDLAGDVKRLTNFTPEYRLRVGDYRVLFQLESNTIVIYRIVHRREAYR